VLTLMIQYGSCTAEMDQMDSPYKPDIRCSSLIKVKHQTTHLFLLPLKPLPAELLSNGQHWSKVDEARD
jgi:hypothetical protein